MKKTAIMQPYFFPYIGYWQLINAVDEFWVYDDVNYIKGGWINRNNILLNSQKHMVTLPLDGASPFLPINQIKRVSNKKNNEKLIKKIEQAYKKAPYFNDIAPIIQETIFHPSDKIADAVYYSIQRVSEYLGIKTKFILSSSIKKDDNLKGKDKVIHICKFLNTTDYINAIGGLELYDKKSFAQEGIILHFLKTKDITYEQFGNEFVPWLSIIDILMFNDIKTVQGYLEDFTLI
jgi:hypothetical protein